MFIARIERDKFLYFVLKSINYDLLHWGCCTMAADNLSRLEALRPHCEMERSNFVMPWCRRKNFYMYAALMKFFEMKRVAYIG